jgi:hypothetical protein
MADLNECRDGVYANAEPELDWCHSLEDEVEKAECIANVQKWIEEMLQKCPQLTCQEEGNA